MRAFGIGGVHPAERNEGDARTVVPLVIVLGLRRDRAVVVLLSRKQGVGEKESRLRRDVPGEFARGGTGCAQHRCPQDQKYPYSHVPYLIRVKLFLLKSFSRSPVRKAKSDQISRLLFPVWWFVIFISRARQNSLRYRR